MSAGRMLSGSAGEIGWLLLVIAPIDGDKNGLRESKPGVGAE
jgi:hypothetical protein